MSTVPDADKVRAQLQLQTTLLYRTAAELQDLSEAIIAVLTRDGDEHGEITKLWERVSSEDHNLLDSLRQLNILRRRAPNAGIEPWEVAELMRQAANHVDKTRRAEIRARHPQ